MGFVFAGYVLFVVCSYFHFSNFLWVLKDFYRTLCRLVISVCSSTTFYDPAINQFNPLIDDKILDWSKMKQIADDILNCI